MSEGRFLSGGRAGAARRWRGELVSFPVDRDSRLDGFLVRPRGRAAWLAVFVHGMFSNFYRSELKQAFFDALPAAGVAVLSINTRGADSATADERFSDSLADIDAALGLGRALGFRHFVLIGHSTGCQKSLHHLDRRCPTDVAGLVLLAPCDDYAIARRDLGRRWALTVARARRLVAAGRGGQVIGPPAMPLTARRFLSLAIRRRVEASLFDYGGPMRAFRRLATPVFVVFGDREEYAVLPVEAMLSRLAGLRPDGGVSAATIRGGDHSFHGREAATAQAVAQWVAALRGARSAPRARGRPGADV